MVYLAKLTIITFFVVTFLVLANAAILDSNRRTKRNVMSGSNLETIVTDLGPGKKVDLLLVLDRSQAMGKSWFYTYEKPLARAILERYAVIHPDWVRVSVITFANDVTIPIDFIRGTNSNLKTKCNMFYGSSPAWDSVKFDNIPEKQKGTNLKAAFEQASLILDAGRTNRPGVDQLLIVMTDGDYDTSTQDPEEEVSNLKSQNVTIAAGGFGPWLETGNVREMATNKGYYGTFTDWNDKVIKMFSRSISVGNYRFIFQCIVNDFSNLIMKLGFYQKLTILLNWHRYIRAASGTNEVGAGGSPLFIHWYHGLSMYN